MNPARAGVRWFLPVLRAAVVRSSILLKLTTFVAILVLVTAGAMGGLGYMFARHMLLQQVNERLTAMASDRHAMLQNHIRQQQDRAIQVADNPILVGLLDRYQRGELGRNALATEVQRLFLAICERSVGIVELWLVDLHGRPIAASSPERLVQDFGETVEFHEGLLGPTLGVPRNVGGQYQALIAAPVCDAAGRTQGVLMVLQDETPLVRLLSNPAGLGITGEVLLGVRRENSVHFILPPRHDPMVSDVPLRYTKAMERAMRGESGCMKTRDYRGVLVLAAYRPVGQRNWGLVVKIDEHEAMTYVRELRRMSLLLGAVIFLVGLAGAHALARRFTRPILALAGTAASAAAGNLDARVTVTNRDEIGQLAETFNRMLDELARSYQALFDSQRKLERSNRDLESFASVAAHDLRDPLITARMLADRVTSLAGETMPEHARKYHKRMMAGMERMLALIDDLLIYARVTSGPQTRSPVDLGDVLRSVLADMDDRIQQTGAQVEVEPMPVIMAEPHQMRQLFQNLIGNAIKFHRPGVAPVVRVRAHLLDGQDSPLQTRRPGSVCRILVEDNGIGFSNEHRERIFGLFQRLHNRDEYEGTGIGLATCRRIAELHGGSISADGRPGEGATFEVLLPVA